MLTLSDLGVTQRNATLSSGVPLILLERPNMPVSVEFLFHSGTRFNPPGRKGLAHFVEHVMVAGTERFPGKDKLAYYIEEVGGNFSASTGPENIRVIFEIAERVDLDRVVLMASEIFSHASFEKNTVETERGSILRELAVKRANPGRTLSDLEMELFFQDTPLGQTNLGTVESINSIEISDLKNYYDNYINRGSLAIAVSGGIGINEVVDKFENNLKIKPRMISEETGDLPIIRKDSIKTMLFTTDEIHFSFGFRSCRDGGDDIFSLNILRTILGGGRTSRLTKKLRYEKGLVYGMSADSPNFSDAGAWMISTSTSKDKIQEVLDIITNEVLSVVSGNITDEEIAIAKARVLKTTKLTMQTSSSWVKAYAELELFGLVEKFGLENYLKRVSELSKDEIVKVAKKYFLPDKWYLAMTGNISNRAIRIDY